MKLECKLEDMHYDFKQKCTKFEFSSYGDITPNLENFQGKNLNMELRKDGKRSLNANGYFWHMLGELQEKLRTPKEDLYRQYIYGCGAYDTYCMKDEAVDTFIKTWTSRGLGWLVDTMKSKIDGCTNVLAYRGTSDYTKDEMAVLLDQVVQDCIDQGIPTKRKEDIDKLLEDM